MPDDLESTDYQLLWGFCFQFVFIETEMNIRDCYECVRVYPLNEQGVPDGFCIKNFITVKDYIWSLREVCVNLRIAHLRVVVHQSQL